MTRHIRFIAAAVTVAAFALTSSAAMAQSYTGNWPVTVTESQRSNGTYCISLSDETNNGFPNGGEATLNGKENPYGGYYTVVEGLITVTFTYPSGEGDCCNFQVFTAHASNGRIGKGVYNYFGIADIGQLIFGKKDACTDSQ